MSGFDPYYKWLAIPPAEQPPNHYRLLGLVLFESDADVISAAADRQMAHIRTFQNGPHRQHSQRLLNEIALARVTLLNPNQKAEYDAKLRSQQGSNGSVNPLPVARPMEAAPAAARPVPRPAPMTARLPAATSPVDHAQPAAPHPVQANPVQAAIAVAPAPVNVGHPQPQIPAIPAAALAPMAPAMRPAPAEAQAEAAEGRPVRRFTRQQMALFWTIFGVVGGGLMGSYLAGVILNVVGADLPDAVRFLPGLGRREVVVVPGDDPNPGNNMPSGSNGNRQSTHLPSNGAVDPWNGLLNGATPQHVGPGFVRLLFLEEGNHAGIAVERTDQLPWGSAAVNKMRIMVPQALKRSPEIVVGRDPDRGLYLTVPPGSTGKLLLSLRGLGPMVFTGQAKASFAADISGGRIDVGIYEDVDPRNFLPSGQSLRAESTFRVDGPIQITTQVQNTSTLSILVTLTADANGPREGVRLYLQSDHGSNTKLSAREFASVQLMLPQGGPSVRPPIPDNNRPPLPGSDNALAQRLQLQELGPLDAKNEARLSGADLANRMADMERRIGGADPRPYLTEGENASNDWATRFTALSLAAKKAVEAGDCFLAAEAYDRLNRWFEGDATAEEAVALKQIYQANPSGFQPVAFAAWSIDVLKRLSADGKLREHGELVKLALLTARQSGDRDLIHEAAAIASQLSAPSN